MGKYLKINPPKRGSKITVAKNGQLQVPDDPIVPFIQGEGLGAQMWKPVQDVLDLAVERCYANAKRLEWLEVYAGQKGDILYGPNNQLPEDTVRAIQEYKVCIKGPLTTPVGAQISLDASLRERLDLFAHLQPIRYLDGTPSPLKNPQNLDILVFREFTEDVYQEIEWKKGSPEAKQLINFLNEDLAKKLNKQVRPDSSVGIKPISATATKRLIRLAIEFALKHKRRSVTLVHSLMRHTEGFFRDWGYELTRKEFNEYCVTEQEVLENHGGEVPRGRLLVKDRPAHQLLQEMLLHPEEFDVIATTNQNGHYLESMSLAAVGETGMAPNAYVGAKAAIFEASPAGPQTEKEGAAELNPTSVLLCGVMLFDHLGWKDSAELVTHALIKTLSDRRAGADGARAMEAINTAAFCEQIIENFEEVRKSRVRQAMKRTPSNAHA